MPRYTGRKGKAGQPSVPADVLPSWYIDRAQCKAGRAEYQIVNTSTGRVLIRGLKLHEAVHYFREVGCDASIGLMSSNMLYKAALGLLLPAHTDDHPSEV